jgi:hypothetical protein
LASLDLLLLRDFLLTAVHVGGEVTQEILAPLAYCSDADVLAFGHIR